jgi:hypothetical protein
MSVTDHVRVERTTDGTLRVAVQAVSDGTWAEQTLEPAEALALAACWGGPLADGYEEIAARLRWAAYRVNAELDAMRGIDRDAATGRAEG